MNLLTDPGLKALQFYSTAVYPCSYIAGMDARSQVAAPTHLIDTPTYSQLVERGFRRSGLFTYRPHCDKCRACIPIRIDVQGFSRNRTQRKLWRRHGELTATEMAPHWKDEHYALYQRYQAGRHPNAGMDEDSQSQYTQFLLTSRVDTRLVEFRLPNGQLQMVSIIDALEQGWSAVYTFYDPEVPGSLGSYGILWQIEQCRLQNLSWLYLGYWIRESRKMAYKSRFEPFEIYEEAVWKRPTAPDQP